MISWGTKRKLKYIISIGFFFAFILVAFIFISIYRPPSCSDNKKNGDEQGIDCGGNCSKVCEAEALPIQIDWVQAFKVKDGIWSVAAHLENPNPNYEVRSVSYKFRIYDSNNTLIAEPRGTAYIPPGHAFGLFEGGLFVGDGIPARASVEFTERINWTKQVSSNNPIIIKDVSRTTDSQGLPKVSAVIQNQGLKAVKNIQGFVFIYDAFGRAISASKTVIDDIEGGQSGNLVFSWPGAFSTDVGRVEVLHWVLPI